MTKSRCICVRKRLQAFASGGKFHGSVGEVSGSVAHPGHSETQNYHHFLDSALQKCQPSQGSWVTGRETQNCRHFWTCASPSPLDSVNAHWDRAGPGREKETCRHCWTCAWSSSLKHVNTHRDRAGPERRGEERRGDRMEDRGEKKGERR